MQRSSARLLEGHSQRERNHWTGPNVFGPLQQVVGNALEEQRDDVLDIGATTEVALAIVEIMLQW